MTQLRWRESDRRWGPTFLCFKSIIQIHFHLASHSSTWLRAGSCFGYWIFNRIMMLSFPRNCNSEKGQNSKKKLCLWEPGSEYENWMVKLIILIFLRGDNGDDAVISWFQMTGFIISHFTVVSTSLFSSRVRTFRFFDIQREEENKRINRIIEDDDHEDETWWDVIFYTQNSFIHFACLPDSSSCKSGASASSIFLKAGLFPLFPDHDDDDDVNLQLPLFTISSPQTFERMKVWLPFWRWFIRPPLLLLLRLGADHTNVIMTRVNHVNPGKRFKIVNSNNSLFWIPESCLSFRSTYALHLSLSLPESTWLWFTRLTSSSWLTGCTKRVLSPAF